MTSRRVDLNLINVFHAIMLERNVTRAARRLAMTQPAVSIALGRLRHLFEDELFVKSRDGVVPTDRARALWVELEGPMTIIRNVTSPARFDPAASTRTFNIAVTESLMSRTVATMAARFAMAAPSARLRILPHSNPISTAALERGELDCAVGMFPHPPATLHVDPLLSDEYICVFRRSHPRLKPPLSLKAFLSARHVLVRQGAAGASAVDDWLGLEGLSREIVLTVGNCHDALAIVLQTDLVTIVPHSFAAFHDLGARISISPIPLERQNILYKLAWHERVHHNAAQVWLRALVGTVVRSLQTQKQRRPTARGRR